MQATAKSRIVLLTLVLCMVLSLAACAGTGKKESAVVPEADAIELGEGKLSFTFEAKDAEGASTYFFIKTNAETVGDALFENGLIEGDEGPYGLYVKTVNKITADYDVDGTYWAFYIDGVYATSSVDVTEITEGSHYMFAVEK